jgi:hypothetical protein
MSQPTQARFTLAIWIETAATIVLSLSLSPRWSVLPLPPLSATPTSYVAICPGGPARPATVHCISKIRKVTKAYRNPRIHLKVNPPIIMFSKTARPSTVQSNAKTIEEEYEQFFFATSDFCCTMCPCAARTSLLWLIIAQKGHYTPIHAFCPSLFNCLRRDWWYTEKIRENS